MIWGCSDPAENDEANSSSKKTTSSETEKTVNPEELVEVIGSTYTEYYDAAKTKIKFQGEQDENKQRHGKWVYFSESGKEMNISHYKNGTLHGFMQVIRPNGALYYHGDFKDGERVGVWKFYDEQGKFSHETDYDKE